MKIFVLLPTGMSYALSLNSRDTIAKLKKKFRRKAGVFSGILNLTVFGIANDNTKEANLKTLQDCGLADRSCVHMAVDFDLELLGKVLNVPIFRFDERYNCDSSAEDESGKAFIRGGEVYHRPYGWFRYALSVSLRFENDEWLGTAGCDTDASSAEWPVAYHGTAKENIGWIVEEGYKLCECTESSHEYGIYTSPLVEIAAVFAEEFTCDGKKYKAVLQNRVNPGSVRKKKGFFQHNGQQVPGPIWISASEGDVRPYGILLKEMCDLSDSADYTYLSSTSFLSLFQQNLTLR